VSAPSGVTAVLVAPIVGRYIGKYDARAFAAASFVIFAISYFMRSAWPPDASVWMFVLPLLVQGVAMGVFFSYATSLTPTYWDRREALHQSRLVESLSAYDPGYSSTLAQLHSQGFRGDSAAALVQHLVIGQGYLMSSLDIFYFSGWLVLLLIPLCWLVRRPSGATGAIASE
jgi:MFS transporter, DHA2 family, multidrug resistance protein